jgi:hypothetical protein
LGSLGDKKIGKLDTNANQRSLAKVEEGKSGKG